jgi:hypothetical protein
VINPTSSFKAKHPFIWYELNWPKDLESSKVTAWLSSLSGYSTSHGIRFVTVATTGKIKHYLVLPSSQATSHTKVLKTYLPDIELRSVDPINISSNLSSRTLMTSHSRSLQISSPEAVAYSLIGSLATIAKGEKLVLVWILGKNFSANFVSNNVSGYSDNWLKAVGEAFVYTPKPLEAQPLNSMRTKKEYPSWQANLFIAVESDSWQRSKALTKRVEAGLHASNAPEVKLGVRKTARQLQIARIPWLWPLKINAPELTGLLGWPLGDQELPGITRIRSKYLPIPSNMQNYGRTIAQDRYSSTKLGMSSEDGMLHTHILGPTGVGKSTLLLNLITQDMQANRAVIVVDPKGDLITDILSRIPENRKNDVIVLDPSDSNSPVGLNPLARSSSNSLPVDNILSVFKGLYGANFGARSQDILYSGLLTLSQVPGMSLSSLPLLFSNEEFRRSLVSKINDPYGLDSFWDWFNNISEAERLTAIAPVMNKIRPFLLRESMRRVICQSEPKLDIAEVLSNRKILLVNLAKGVLGSETSQLFGSIVVSQIWQAIQTRANLPISNRPPAFVYIDEIQDYLHLPTDIGDVLAQSRSYGVGMVLAHQHLAQLPTDLRAGILANARNRVCFQLGHSDASEMAKTSEVLTPSDFESLDRYNIYASLVKNGSIQPWISGVTLPPSDKTSNPAEIGELSAQNYGVPVSEIDSAFTKLITDNSQADSDILSRKIEAGVSR